MDKSKMPSRPVSPNSLSTGLRSVPSTYESSIVLVLDPNLRYMNELKNMLNKVFSRKCFHMVSGSIYQNRMAFAMFFSIFLKVLLEEVTKISNLISG